MIWLGSINPERWVDIIRYLSLLLTAAFGLVALFTDYKKDGTITRWGKLAAGGILFSALLSIASGVMQDKIDAAKDKRSRDERDAQSAQLAQQVALLHDLNRNMAASMEIATRTLNEQYNLLAGQSASINQNVRLADYQRRSAARLLYNIWEGSNTVLSNQIVLTITNVCEFPTRELPLDGVLTNNNRVTIFVDTRANHLRPSSPTFSNIVLSTENRPVAYFAAVSTAYGRTDTRDLLVAADLVGHLGDLSSFVSWTGISMKFSLSGTMLPAAIEHMGDLRWAVNETGARFARLPCTARFFLTIRGREVATSEANPVVYQSHEGGRTLYTFSVDAHAAVNNAEIPRRPNYSATSTRPSFTQGAQQGL